MPQIKDFGQKIGGARKDAWKYSGITDNDFAEMNDMERSTYVKKDNIWIKPNWEQLIADGTPQAVAYWQNQVRLALPPKPQSADEDVQKDYISAISKLRDLVMAAKSEEDLRGFYEKTFLPAFTTTYKTEYSTYRTYLPETNDVFNRKVMRAVQPRYYSLEKEAKQKLFGVPKNQQAYVATKQQMEIYCYDKSTVTLEPDPHDDSSSRLIIGSGYGRSFYYLRQGNEFADISKWQENTFFVIGRNRKPLRINLPTREEAEAFIESFAQAAQIAADMEAGNKGKENDNSNRKKNFVPPQLAHIKYSGPNYRGVCPAEGKMFQDDLNFRAGEFGNWLNTADRQTSLNMAYDALRNLADLLQIKPKDVSLNGNLAIAFGARGRGGAGAGAAHYEPLRQVINLTKMSGAGCLAHEWAHALDHAIGIKFGAKEFASEARGRAANSIPYAFDELMDKLKYKEAIVPAEVMKSEWDPEIRNAQTNLRNWISSTKPSKLPESLEKAWDEITENILKHPETFTGNEYSRYSSSTILTHPDVEQLSQIAKHVTNHVIPRSSKLQFALWAREINKYQARAQAAQSTKKRVKTDFYEGSMEFDKIYSKYGHGYWQSDCEMFARAFDCYIADKIKEAGYRSDYLSARADSFYFKQDDKVIAAFPRGEERTVINQAFDALFKDLKEREFLHEAPVPEMAAVADKDLPPQEPTHTNFPEEEKNVHYEQLSLVELLFNASARAAGAAASKGNPTKDRSR